MNGFTRSFDETKCMSSLIEDNKLLEKYNKIWIKSTIVLKKKIASKPVESKKYLNTKIKFYKVKFFCKFFIMVKIPKEGSHCICLSMTLILFYKKDENHYPQVFLKNLSK